MKTSELRKGRKAFLNQSGSKNTQLSEVVTTEISPMRKFVGDTLSFTAGFVIAPLVIDGIRLLVKKLQ